VKKKHVSQNVKINKMKTINSWKSKVKQSDKIDITVRISSLSIFELNIDFSKKSYRLVILNFGINS
jgi:hypothetical protein